MNQLNPSENCSWEQLQRDPAAFERFFKSTAAALCAYALRIVKDKQAAEDIVQDFFSRLWQKRQQISMGVPPQRYAYRAVHNTCLNYLRDNTLISNDALPENIPAEDDVLEQELRLQDRVQQLERVIAGLPAQCRIVFEKVCLEQKKYKAVAEELGISVFTVRNQVAKAYDILRNNILLELTGLLLLDLLSRF
ncbi:RNA polymerase sigma-70 factor [Chitinophaga qingshengii]|uniref:RNA polymerase sigma-70 factor n=1 Tax=Chitinophaga qingshengii TaxID=1569794 RepID=A0ABR7TXV9_9BACT|nr:RNA polymerase sigma-70 factor [Chitinophaga qingshengii]MBC9934542.1 RNA polymerase sigma-70 factor [Chitinophaga qingshengii]